MYCIKCGIELSEGQTVCPVCETRVYHPDLQITEKSTYPKIPFKSEEFNRQGLIFVISMLFLIAMLLPLFLELGWHDRVSWSGYSSGGVLTFYLIFVLPFWFRHPNPVIFVPTSFATVILYLLYLCLATGGSWFLTFALPVTVGFALIVTALAALLRYVKRGVLYTVGGFLIALGLWTVLLEFLIRYTFGITSAFIWSSATLTVFSILGIMLIVIAVVKPLGDSLRRIFFIGKV